ncbi:hypothetical protein KR222_006297, partial [Zaprionus bogoriensis]
MKFRSNFLPRHPLEIYCFLSIAGFLPIVSLYEILYVLPAIHAPGTFLHTFTFVIWTFLLINIEGNLLACMIIDTSVAHERVKESEECKEWRYCKYCERRAPPRSWHCQQCGHCILKRDHHCTFTGCCIGHRNERYFQCFLLYLGIASAVSLCYNVYYMFALNADVYLAFFRPRNVFADFRGLQSICQNAQIIVFNLNIILAVFLCSSICCYVPRLLRGQVCYESEKKLNLYDQGIYRNLRSVFGRRMYVAWLFPTMRSELPDDGYSWRSNASGEN